MRSGRIPIRKQRLSRQAGHSRRVDGETRCSPDFDVQVKSCKKREKLKNYLQEKKAATRKLTQQKKKEETKAFCSFLLSCGKGNKLRALFHTDTLNNYIQTADRLVINFQT